MFGKRFLKTRGPHLQYLLLAVAFGRYAYAANKFTLGANFFQKSFKKDKTYTLTRKNVNNTAFVYWIISWARRESLKTYDFSSLICDQAVLRFSHFSLGGLIASYF